MLTSLRRSYTQLITSGGQLLLLFAGFHFNSPTSWYWCLGSIAVISLFVWHSALHRVRLITGTPTSRVVSAAQGYVELVGDALPLNAPILAKHSMLPCLWYRYKVDKKNHKNEWRTVESGESDAHFMVRDDSGKCVIDPQGAEIITQHKDSWQRGEYRYTEWKLLERDAIYLLGEFRTAGGSTNTTTQNEMVKLVLYEWKRDNANLLKRFDLNNNGLLDMDEWMLARLAAKREANKRLAEIRAEPDTHYLTNPQDGRLFLISNLSPENLARRFSIWTWIHLTIFFGAMGGLAWLLSRNGL